MFSTYDSTLSSKILIAWQKQVPCSYLDLIQFLDIKRFHNVAFRKLVITAKNISYKMVLIPTLLLVPDFFHLKKQRKEK